MSFRLAAQESMLEGESLEQKFEFAQAHGFDGIELSGRGGGVFEGRAQELAAARVAGVVMPSAVVAMPYFVGDFDETNRRSAIDDVKRLLSTLPAAGAAGIVMPNGFGVFSKRVPRFSPPRPVHRPLGKATARIDVDITAGSSRGRCDRVRVVPHR